MNRKIKFGLFTIGSLFAMFSMTMGVSARTLSEAYNNKPSDADLSKGPKWVVHKASDGKMGYCMNAEKTNGQAGYSYTLDESNNATYNASLRTQYGYIIKSLSTQRGDARQYYITQYSIYRLQKESGIIGKRWKDTQFGLDTVGGVNIKAIVDNSKKVSNDFVISAPSKASLSEDGKYYVAKISVSRPSVSTILSAGSISISGQPNGAIISDSKNGTNNITSLSEGKEYYLKIPAEIVESESSTDVLNVTITASAATKVAVGRQYCRNGNCSNPYQNLIFMDEVPENHSGSKTIKFQIECNFDNPAHFHQTDGSDDQDYKSNNKTSTCCAWAIKRYGEEEATNRYPICGSCPVKTSSKVNGCGTSKDGSIILTDEHDFSCLFKGISSSSANKYDYSSREAIRKKYKVGSIGTKYCEVYCTDDIVAKFPGNYQGNVAPGGSFIWPSFNDNYKATVETTRTCKIRFRQQEWVNDFNKGNDSAKQKLVSALKECASANAINAYYDKYIDSLDPDLTLSYNNGLTTIGPKTLKLDTKRSTYNKACDGCDVSTSGVTTGNVLSMLNGIASGITSKALTIKTNLRYVLPDGLYQYVDKKSGKPLEDYIPKDPVNSNGTVDNTKVTDSGNSKLMVSDKAKTGQKYDVTIHYSSLSSVKNKFKNESGNYTCKYTPSNDPVGNQCDINEPNHFESEDSGPNGENCCEWFADKYGTDSEEYLELVERGDCPECKDPNDPTCPGNNSCVYPDDLTTPDVAVKNKCCAMILVDQRYTLEERRAYYDQYCTGEPYCPQDCVNGVCHTSSMTQGFRNCINTGKSYNECKADNCPGGGQILIYRPISLIANEAFPGAEKQNRIWSNNNWYYYSNWAYRGKSKKRDYYVDMYITNNRGVKEYDLYSTLDPMYVIKMDSKTIRTIRSYNTANSYDDFNLKCNKNGRQCRSDFVKQYATGCGVGGWYDCQGISKARGD